MLTSDLWPVVEGLNQKRYAQQSDPAALADTDLTAAEKALIETCRPSQWLVIYGTLAPGRPNHHVVEPIRGTWQTGTIRGALKKEGWGAQLGYYGFVPTQGPEQVEIAVHVLGSDELANYWPMLDAFEGDGYQRILVPFTLDSGQTGVGHLYALQGETRR